MTLWSRLREFPEDLWYWGLRHWLACSLVLLTLSFGVVFLADRIFIFVYPGQAGVVWRRFSGGTDMDTIYGEGMHLIFPWNKVYIYNVRVQEMMREQEALTQNGLSVKVGVSFRFQPNYQLLPRLHQVYGPEYVEKEVVPELASAIQQIVAEYEPDDLYTLQRKTSEVRMLNIAKSNLAPGSELVFIHDVSMVKIILPQRVQDAIQQKLEEEQMSLLYDYRIERERKEAIRKSIEAEGIAEFQAIVAEGISEPLLKWKGIEATENLAKSPNAKVVVIGSGDGGLPIILGGLGEPAQ